MSQQDVSNIVLQNQVVEKRNNDDQLQLNTICGYYKLLVI